MNSAALWYKILKLKMLFVIETQYVAKGMWTHTFGLIVYIFIVYIRKTYNRKCRNLTIRDILQPKLFSTGYPKCSTGNTSGKTFGKILNLFSFQQCSMYKFSHLSSVILCLQMFLLRHSSFGFLGHSYQQIWVSLNKTCDTEWTQAHSQFPLICEKTHYPLTHCQCYFSQFRAFLHDWAH